jgi:hypothetical protein
VLPDELCRNGRTWCCGAEGSNLGGSSHKGSCPFSRNLRSGFESGTTELLFSAWHHFNVILAFSFSKLAQLFTGTKLSPQIVTSGREHGLMLISTVYCLFHVVSLHSGVAADTLQLSTPMH